MDNSQIQTPSIKTSEIERGTELLDQIADVYHEFCPACKALLKSKTSGLTRPEPEIPIAISGTNQNDYRA